MRRGRSEGIAKRGENDWSDCNGTQREMEAMVLVRVCACERIRKVMNVDPRMSNIIRGRA